MWPKINAKESQLKSLRDPHKPGYAPSTHST